jgi:ParB-like chromosome segregation protein Spo0J
VIPWRNVLKVHRAAEQFPLLKDTQPDEFEALVEDIERNGLQERIKLVFDGSAFIVVDGRNRLSALEELGWDEWRGMVESGKPDPEWFEVMNVSLPSNAEVEAYVLSLNVHRRHLPPMSAEERRQLIARVLRQNPEKSNRHVAEKIGADDKTVGVVRQALEATAEIPRLEKTVGKDGRARKKSEAKAKPKSEAPPKEEAGGYDVTPVVDCEEPYVPGLDAATALDKPNKNWEVASEEERAAFMAAAERRSYVEDRSSETTAPAPSLDAAGWEKAGPRARQEFFADISKTFLSSLLPEQRRWLYAHLSREFDGESDAVPSAAAQKVAPVSLDRVRKDIGAPL